ncbi:hypothetical protein [Noviherbaspirillum soli]|uniref:hypothetical protein n=1 Tax=Noviherbaspirillum soli TaxID=1064518 RepID=UPI00188BEBE0|nr:hypothetical protein [Noviherbaspirillum soli]
MKYFHLAAGFVAACFFANVQAAGPGFDPAQLTSKHDAGIDFAKSQLGKSAANVNLNNAKSTPFYNPSPKQAAGFASTDIFGIGSSRITECKTEAKGTDKVANQECEAVNFLAKNPDNRKRFQLPSNDPAILAGRDAINKAKKDTLSENGCVMRTTTTPSQSRIESCNEYNPIEASNCIMGREIVVDDYSNYQCDQTLNAYEYPKCNKSPYFNTVMTPSCAVGSEVSVSSWSASMNKDPCRGGDNLVVKYVCDATDTPTLRVLISENQNADGANYNGLQPSNYYQTVAFNNCKATIRGNTSCTNGTCSGNYYADIFYGPPPVTYYCPDGSQPITDWETGQQVCYVNGFGYLPADAYEGDSRGSYSGTLSLQANFQTYSKTVQYAGTTNTCQALEARTW